MFNVVEETSKMAVESNDIRRWGIVTDDGGGDGDDECCHVRACRANTWTAIAALVH